MVVHQVNKAWTTWDHGSSFLFIEAACARCHGIHCVHRFRLPNAWDIQQRLGSGVPYGSLRKNTLTHETYRPIGFSTLTLGADFLETWKSKQLPQATKPD